MDRRIKEGKKTSTGGNKTYIVKGLGEISKKEMIKKVETPGEFPRYETIGKGKDKYIRSKKNKTPNDNINKDN